MAQLVPCGTGQAIICDDNGNNCQPNPQWRRCELSDVFVIIKNVYLFILWSIITPLAGLVIVAGGVMFMMAGGNPGLASKATNMIKWAVISVLLAYGSWLIINTLLLALGYVKAGDWFNLTF